MSRVDPDIKYPCYYPRQPWFERLMIRVGYGPLISCTVCGSRGLIRIRGNNLRETCRCYRCRSTNRQRQIAYVILRALTRAKRGRWSSLAAVPSLGGYAVFNTAAAGPVHEQLRRMPSYVCSEYYGAGYRSGEIVHGVLHEDLTQLSLETASVDLVISSEVLEHVPEPYQAHSEIHRVLKSGGTHVFTVPFYQTEYCDEERATVDGEGNVKFLAEPMYHLDPLRQEGALVYRVFALEMLVKLWRIGFRTNLYRLYSPKHGILGPNAVVFEAVKA